MNPIELGKFLANLRNEKNLTQEELADKLFIDKKKEFNERGFFCFPVQKVSRVPDERVGHPLSHMSAKRE